MTTHAAGAGVVVVVVAGTTVVVVGAIVVVDAVGEVGDAAAEGGPTVELEVVVLPPVGPVWATADGAADRTHPRRQVSAATAAAARGRVMGRGRVPYDDGGTGGWGIC